MSNEENYAVNELYTWFRRNQDYFIGCGMKLAFRDAGRNSASVAIEDDSYLIDICAWDHVSCLDIAVMEVASKETQYPHTGECKNKDEFVSHLNSLLCWHQNAHGNT